jgi:hypothetical protein
MCMFGQRSVARGLVCHKSVLHTLLNVSVTKVQLDSLLLIPQKVCCSWVLHSVEDLAVLSWAFFK